MKNKKINEGLDLSFSNRLNSILKQFTTSHQFETFNKELSEQEVSSLSSLIFKWEKLGNDKEQKSNVEAEIINMLQSFTKDDKQDVVNDEEIEEDSEVPTVPFEGVRFKNIKTFDEMFKEGISSELSKFRSNAKAELRNKLNSITKSEPKSKVVEKPKKDDAKVSAYVKPEHKEKSVSDLKSEISSKMKDLDKMLTTNTDTVAIKSQEVKQLLEKLSVLLSKI